MKKSPIALICFLLLAISNVDAQTSNRLEKYSGEPRFLFAGGFQYGGLLGSGVAENKFSLNSGFMFDFGAIFKGGYGVNFLGIYWNKADNTVKNSTIETMHLKMGMEFRKNYHYGGIDPFWSIGGGVGLITFELNNVYDSFSTFFDDEGIDTQWYFSPGAGFIYWSEGDIIGIQVDAKPFLMFNNMFEQSFGFDIHVGIVVGWKSKRF